ncbi:phage polarity suppression protein, partial [Photorhabdus asymbiotica]
LQQAFDACQTSKTSWHNRKAELAEVEAELAAVLAVSSPGNAEKIAPLRERFDVKSWEVNRSAGLYIRSHEEVQRISIRDRLNDFMQQHGAELAAALAPELMGIKKTACYDTKSRCRPLNDISAGSSHRVDRYGGGN